MKLLIAEDEIDLAEALTAFFEKNQFTVEAVHNGADAYDYAGNGAYDVVILDVMMPGMNGIEVLRRLREDGIHTPIMMLTAKAQKDDRIEGFDAGADDYISKPFGMMEMVARVRAVLRRSAQEARASDYRFGPLYICPERHEARVDGAPVALTHKEFMLLRLLVENRGMVLTREVLLDRIWGCGADRENRTLDVHIRTLRAKLGAAGGYIQTVRGVGYRMTEETT